MDENGHIELHLRLDAAWEEVDSRQPQQKFPLMVSCAELGVLTAALSLLGQLTDDYIVSLALDEYGELDDPRETERRLMLEHMTSALYEAYLGKVLGVALKA